MMMGLSNELEWQRDIDRLVDGELSSSEESQLLARLDATSEGWKRLALAFIESRRWRRALSSREAVSVRESQSAREAAWSEMSNPELSDCRRGHAVPAKSEVVAPAALATVVSRSDRPSSPVLVGIVASPPGSGVPSPFDRLFLAALAMSLLVGIAGGLAIAVWRSAHSPSIAGRDDEPNAPRSIPGNSIAPQNRNVSRNANETVWSPAVPGKAVPVGRNDNVQTLENETLTLIVGDDSPGSAKQIDVPLVPASQVDPKWLDASSARVPETVRKAWERQGRQVDVQRRFYQVDLSDGRRVLVPIDDVEVRTIGVQ